MELGLLPIFLICSQLLAQAGKENRRLEIWNKQISLYRENSSS